MVKFEGYSESEEVPIGMLRVKKNRKRKRGSSERDHRNSRDRSRKRRRRSRSRDRSRRDRNRRSGSERDRRGNSREKDGFVSYVDDHYPLALTNEVLDKIVKERRSKSVFAKGHKYSRGVIGLKAGLSGSLEVSTNRVRSPSPVDRRRRNYGSRAPPKLDTSKRKNVQPSEQFMQKQKKLLDMYGDASSNAKV